MATELIYEECPSVGERPGSEVGCRFCGKKDSDRWHFNDICRSCRRKQLKNTPKALKEREIKLYIKNNPRCWDCGSEDSRRWYKDCTQCEKCMGKEYRKDNKERRKKYQKAYQKLNKDSINERKRAYRKSTGKHRIRQRQRKKKIKDATPLWVDKKELFKIYTNCPSGYTVDHIIPLKNNFVSGLHVPWNL